MKRVWPIISYILLVLVVIAALGAAGYLYYQNNNLKKENTSLSDQINHPEKAAKDLKDQVGKLMDLPADEDPQIAIVQDIETIKKDQPFFNNGANGDKILIFQKAKKAILYRPSTNRIIEVGPVTTDPNAGTAKPSTP